MRGPLPNRVTLLLKQGCQGLAWYSVYKFEAEKLNGLCPQFMLVAVTAWPTNQPTEHNLFAYWIRCLNFVWREKHLIFFNLISILGKYNALQILFRKSYSELIRKGCICSSISFLLLSFFFVLSFVRNQIQCMHLDSDL